MEMKKISLIAPVLCLVLLSCHHVSLRCEPDVVVTNIDYTSDPCSVPYGDAHQKFADNYYGTDLSFDLKNALVDRMAEIADSLGEDGDVLKECVIAAYGDSWDSQPMRIPCYAEKCVYDSSEVWAIVFNRENDYNSNIVHFDLFFISLDTKAVLYTDGCY
ncbi:MAG TPA: hypothetical protein VF399_11415 [bacterium]